MLFHEIKINQPFDWFCLFFLICWLSFPLFFSSCEKLAFLPDLVRWDIPRWRAGKAQVNETMLATTSILPFSLFLSSSSSLPCHFPSAVFFCTSLLLPIFLSTICFIYFFPSSICLHILWAWQFIEFHYW